MDHSRNRSRENRGDLPIGRSQSIPSSSKHSRSSNNSSIHSRRASTGTPEDSRQDNDKKIMKRSSDEGDHHRSPIKDTSQHTNRSKMQQLQSQLQEQKESEEVDMIGWGNSSDNNNIQEDQTNNNEALGCTGNSSTNRRKGRRTLVGFRGPKILSSSSAHTTRSQSPRSGVGDRKSKHEMKLMCEDYEKRIEEYETKLKQRDDAIRSLEEALAIQTEKVDLLLQGENQLKKVIQIDTLNKMITLIQEDTIGKMQNEISLIQSNPADSNNSDHHHHQYLNETWQQPRQNKNNKRINSSNGHKKQNDDFVEKAKRNTLSNGDVQEQYNNYKFPSNYSNNKNVMNNDDDADYYTRSINEETYSDDDEYYSR